MRTSRKKVFSLLLIIICALIASNYRPIIKAINVYDGTVGLRGCKWDDTPAQVMKTINQSIEFVNDYNGYALYETTSAVTVGAIKRAWITFYFDKQTAKLKMVDYSFDEKDYNTAQTLLKLQYNSSENPVFNPKGSETHLFKSKIYAHITIVPYGEDYRVWDITM